MLPGQTAASWAQQRGVSLTAPVNPYQGGVPFYLLIVGSPDRISFEFQALLKMQWAVGRLYFDNIEDYGRYAQKVVEYESKTFTPVQSKNTAFWVTRNFGDAATAILCGAHFPGFSRARELARRAAAIQSKPLHGRQSHQDAADRDPPRQRAGRTAGGDLYRLSRV